MMDHVKYRDVAFILSHTIFNGLGVWFEDVSGFCQWWFRFKLLVQIPARPVPGVFRRSHQRILVVDFGGPKQVLSWVKKDSPADVAVKYGSRPSPGADFLDLEERKNITHHIKLLKFNVKVGWSWYFFNRGKWNGSNEVWGHGGLHGGCGSSKAEGQRGGDRLHPEFWVPKDRKDMKRWNRKILKLQKTDCWIIQYYIYNIIKHACKTCSILIFLWFIYTTKESRSKIIGCTKNHNISQYIGQPLRFL